MKIKKRLSIFCKVDYTGYADRQHRGRLSDSVYMERIKTRQGRDTRERV